MFDKPSGIIKDSSKLDYDYIPKNLVNRERQLGELETFFMPLAESDRSCTAFLKGNVGTGKTVTARKFCHDMTDYFNKKGRPICVLYINCRIHNSENAVLLNLIHHFDPGYPDRGFSTEEMSRVLRLHLKSNKTALVIIFDEVDVLLKKKQVDIIYQITRFSDELSQAAPVSLIMISQVSIYELMDEASSSTFRRSNMIQFDKYTYDELRQIVSDRAEEAIYPGKISDDVLDQIAESSEEYGDARLAIEILEKGARLADSDGEKEITVENIRAVKASLYSHVSESKIMDLDTNRKIALLAVARAMKQNPSITLAAAEKTYAVVCEEYNVAARKHTQFWIYIQDLERIGVLRTKVTGDNKRGRSTVISLPDVPSKALAKNVAAMLDSECNDDGDYDDL